MKAEVDASLLYRMSRAMIPKLKKYRPIDTTITLIAVDDKLFLKGEFENMQTMPATVIQPGNCTMLLLHFADVAKAQKDSKSLVIETANDKVHIGWMLVKKQTPHRDSF